MDFIVSTDLSTLPKSIEFNADELKKELAPRLDFYKSLVVTEDSIKQAKADKASLNRLKTAIEDKRKEVKKACLAPYESFEAECKEIVRMIDEPVVSIDSQIKAFDEIKMQEKWAEICNHFESAVCDLRGSVEVEKVVSKKWKNTTMKIDDIKVEMDNELERIRQDVHSLEVEFAGVPYFAAIMHKYYELYNISQARVVAATLHTHEERLKREAEKKASCEPPAQPVEPVRVSEQINPPIQQDAPQSVDRQVHGTFHVFGTVGQIIALRDYMKNSGIKYEIVKEKK